MLIQLLIVGLVVAASVIYAAWSLMPQMARRALARVLLRWPLPTRVSDFLAQATQRGGGCNCDGCERSSVKGVGGRRPDARTTKPLVFHPRQR